MNTGPDPYDLPEGKEYHMFIACSAEDSEKGRWLMKQLESRYPFPCVYHERDFQPGVTIVENMRSFFDKSVIILVLISNAFTGGLHPTLDQAFLVPNEKEKKCIIPVFIEDVILPHVLSQMTYIDWRLNVQTDVVADIRKEYCRRVISGERCDNGKRIGCIAGHYSSFFFRGCGFTFEDVNIDLEDFEDNSRENIEALCFDTIETLNSRLAVKCYGCFTLRGRCVSILIYCLVYFILVFVIYGIKVSVNKEPYDVSVLWTTLTAGIVLIFVCYNIVMGCIGPWKFILLYLQHKFPEFVYNNETYEEFVLLYLRNKFPEFSHVDGGYEEWADKLIECTIAYYSHDIIHWEDLQKSSYNRHGIWKQRECICQLVEPHLSELSLGQCVWFTNLGKREHKTFSNGTVTYGRTIIL